MEFFINSSVCGYLLLDREFLERDIILTNNEISKLQIAFGKVANQRKKAAARKDKVSILKGRRRPKK